MLLDVVVERVSVAIPSADVHADDTRVGAKRLLELPHERGGFRVGGEAPAGRRGTAAMPALGTSAAAASNIGSAAGRSNRRSVGSMAKVAA